MSSISAQLARRSIANHGVQAQRTVDLAYLSFEAESEAMAADIEAGIAEQDALQAEATGISDSIVNDVSGANSLSDLVDQSIAVYGDAGISEQGAKALEVSVECVLRSMGMNVKASIILPSFENCKSRIAYSTEAEEQKQGILQRIWDLIVKAFSGLGDKIMEIYDKLRNNTNSLQAYSTRVRERLETVKGATPNGDLKLGGDGNLTKSGEASSVLQTVNSDYSKFIEAWKKEFDPIMSQQTHAAINDGNIEQIVAAGKDLKLPSSLKWAITPFHNLEITPGAGENGLDGAKVKILPTEATSGTTFKYLSESQMKEALDAADKVLQDLVEIQKDIDNWQKVFKDLKRNGRQLQIGGQVARVAGEKMAEKSANWRSAGNLLVSASRVAVDGYANTFSPVLKTLRANILYVAKSANGYGKEEKAKEPEAKPAEKPDDKSADNKEE